MHQESRRGASRIEGASLKAMAGARRAAAGPDSRFTRRRHRLRAGLAQLLFVVAGLVAGIFVPKITVSPLVSSGKIVNLLFTADVTAAWVDNSLASKFPVIWADTATTGHGQVAEQPPGSR